MGASSYLCFRTAVGEALSVWGSFALVDSPQLGGCRLFSWPADLCQSRNEVRLPMRKTQKAVIYGRGEIPPNSLLIFALPGARGKSGDGWWKVFPSPESLSGLNPKPSDYERREISLLTYMIKNERGLSSISMRKSIYRDLLSSSIYERIDR